MNTSEATPGAILRGPIFPEPVQAITVIPMGSAVKLVATGLRSSKTYTPILNEGQFALLERSPDKESFDGDARKFRLGVEATLTQQALRSRQATLRACGEDQGLPIKAGRSSQPGDSGGRDAVSRKNTPIKAQEYRIFRKIESNLRIRGMKYPLTLLVLIDTSLT